MHTDIFRRLRDAVRRKHPPKLRTNSWFLLHDNAPAHWSVLVKDFLAKNYLTTLQHPYTLLTWLQLIFNCCPDWSQQWRQGALVMLMTSLRKSWKGSHKMASKNVSNTFTYTGRNVQLHKGTIWRKCSLDDCTVLYFSEIKWFWEHFEATVCYCTFCYLYRECCR